MKVKLVRKSLAALVAFAAFAPLSYANDVPDNLGYGLKDLVESSRALKAPQTNQPLFNGYATEAAAYYGSQAITDAETGRVLVDITLNGRVDLDTVKADAESRIPSLSIRATDRGYRSVGILEGYVSVDDAPALAKLAGVRGVFLSLKPEVNRSGPAPSALPGEHFFKLGTTFDQGVTQHRVDRINQIYNPNAPVNYDGLGMSIGLLSDSFDTRTAAPHAATAVANFDLPGAAANPVGNTQPVIVLEDEPAAGTDEGRAMAEIVYKMAPRAHIAFATGAIGEVQFGNDIRAMAGIAGFTYPPAVQQGFKADTIADDISYGGEPFYGESIIGNAIDDATAVGVSYFSSAGNNIGINAYESALRIVPNGTGLTSATNSALAGTNINLTGVPAGLYAGGFHNFNPAAGQLDVAQLVNMPTAAQTTEMQWDDPYDQRDLTLNQPPIYSNTGTSAGGSSVTFDQTSTPPLPPLTAGQSYVIQETATSGNFDGIVSIFDSSNNLIVSQDTGTDETVTFYPPTTDQYHIVVAPFSTTAGNFSLTINTANGVAGVTSDLNLLVFRADTGAYIAARSLTTNNLANNRPVELGSVASPSGQTQVQFVISRSNTPSAPQLPTRVRWSVRGNGAGGIGPAEYFAYNAVTTKGHATAKGCNGTAAYSVFRPSMAETFTSPGPATILFDKNSNRLAVPEIRQQPRVAAADAANESFFSGDSTGDLDTNPNFSGTSAAAPHAAAIAALVLQSRGGPGTVTPAQMTTILQTSAFPHDLDPSSATGNAVTSDGGAVTITIDSDGDSNAATGQNDPNSFKVTYNGPGSLASLTFNALGSNATAGHVTAGNNGYSDDAGSSPATITYFDNSYPGLLFLPTQKAFTLGTLTGLTPADVTTPLNAAPFTGFSNLAGPPANGTNQFMTMSIGFPTAQFTDGKVLRFTVARGATHSASVAGTVPGTGPTGGTITLNPLADLFGGGVILPSGTVVADGMAFSGTTTSGGTFSGRIRNRIGAGYSPIDGYGFIDASVATGANTTTLLASGTATPSFAYAGASTLFTVNVTPGTNPSSSGVYVAADLSSIGGNPQQQFFDDGTHGDVTAGDNVYSFSATVANGTPSGAKSLPVSVNDVQSRSGSALISFSVLAPTNPSGAGSASPNSVAVTQQSLLTVAVTPGAGPASSGINVKADLSSIGGSATSAFHDDGLNGDVTAGDGVYSFNATVALGTTPGAKSFPVSITDAQSRSATASIGLTVLTPTAPSGSGNATPNSGIVSSTALFTVAVTGGTNPASSSVTVTADLSSIGGSATQQLFDDGTNGDATALDGTYSFNATIGNTATPGPHAIPVVISDGQGRSSSTSIAFNVQSSGAPSGNGLATPTSVSQGFATTLIVSVSPGTNPPSTGLAVTVDLSSIGGSATQTFYDDGTNGDQVGGDNIFSYTVTIPNNVTNGVKTLPATITDAQSRTGSATITLTVSDVIFQNGFE